jgi:hypothetical protein
MKGCCAKVPVQTQGYLEALWVWAPSEVRFVLAQAFTSPAEPRPATNASAMVIYFWCLILGIPASVTHLNFCLY